jgi:hypothetical protein
VSIHLLPPYLHEHYEIAERHHATAVLAVDFEQELRDLVQVLADFRLRRSYLGKAEDITAKAGNKSPIAKALDGAFADRGWEEHGFAINVTVDGEETLAPTHKVDYFKNRVAVETEWNNKDPFFDRDLTTFRLLHEYNVVSVGIVITRADELQQLMNELGRGKSYGANTTHWSQLVPRLANRVSGGCPVLAFGIRRSLYDPNS